MNFFSSLFSAIRRFVSRNLLGVIFVGLLLAAPTLAPMFASAGFPALSSIFGALAGVGSTLLGWAGAAWGALAAGAASVGSWFGGLLLWQKALAIAGLVYLLDPAGLFHAVSTVTSSAVKFTVGLVGAMTSGLVDGLTDSASNSTLFWLLLLAAAAFCWWFFFARRRDDVVIDARSSSADYQLSEA